MDISRRKKPGMLKSCAKLGMLISGAWTWNQVHINVHNYEAVYPYQMHEHGSQVTYSITYCMQDQTEQDLVDMT